eukprot:353588-Chlamydomonas_euryale.AAC.4
MRGADFSTTHDVASTLPPKRMQASLPLRRTGSTRGGSVGACRLGGARPHARAHTCALAKLCSKAQGVSGHGDAAPPPCMC